MNVLGRLIQGDSGIRFAWNSLKPKLWRAFYANCRRKNWKKLGQRRGCNLIFRAVDPIIAHGVGAWPPRHGISLGMNVLSVGMAWLLDYTLQQTSRSKTSTLGSLIVWSIIESAGWWSRIWFQMAISWAAHLDRDFKQRKTFFDSGVLARWIAVNFAWAALLQNTCDDTCIALHRIFFKTGPFSESSCSRTGSRAIRGKVHTRRCEGIVYARNMVS